MSTIKSDRRFKGRLYVQSFSQVYGFDFNETFSPTLMADSLRILLAGRRNLYERPRGLSDIRYVKVENSFFEAVKMSIVSC